LKPEGQALLNQIAQSLTGLSDSFELRIESYTDIDAESADTASGKPEKPHFSNGWDLTAARATTIERYYRDQTSLTFQNVLVSARGDSQPIATSAKDTARNRRIEISLAPIPASFHADASTAASDTAAAPAKEKARDKSADKATDKTDKSVDKSTAKSSDKPDKTADKVTPKSADKSDKTSDKSPARNPDKDKNKDTDKAQ